MGSNGVGEDRESLPHEHVVHAMDLLSRRS